MGLMDFEKSRDLVKFGKFLVNHLDIPVQGDDLDWFFILDQYQQSEMPTIPGLMYMNWVISKYFDQDPQEVRYSKSQRDELARPRRIAQYLAIKKFGYKSSQVQKFYEKKAHATILYNAKTVENEMKTDKLLASDVNKFSSIPIKE
jgi:chromosomal replication initiation ATPase DnaA